MKFIDGIIAKALETSEKFTKIRKEVTEVTILMNDLMENFGSIVKSLTTLTIAVQQQQVAINELRAVQGQIIRSAKADTSIDDSLVIKSKETAKKPN